MVIGGTSGMGKMVSQLVLERGGSAVVVGHLDDRVAATVKELSHLGVVTGEKADLTSVSEMEDLRSRIDSKHVDAD